VEGNVRITPGCKPLFIDALRRGAEALPSDAVNLWGFSTALASDKWFSRTLVISGVT
jgi:hypothetical protein